MDKMDLEAKEAEIAKVKTTAVSCRKLAKLIGRSYPSTLRLIRMKRIVAHKNGDVWNVTLEEVKRFLVHGNHPDALTEDPKDA